MSLSYLNIIYVTDEYNLIFMKYSGPSTSSMYYGALTCVTNSYYTRCKHNFFQNIRTPYICSFFVDGI